MLTVIARPGAMPDQSCPAIAARTFSHTAAAAVCEKVRGAIAGHDWSRIASGLAITVSIGWCADTTLAGPETMLGAADAALYRAKAAGRNRIAGGKSSG
jgi:PleD family two-component response regulator